MRLDHLPQSVTLRVWPDLDLVVNLDFDLYYAKSISFAAAWWEDFDDAWILALRSRWADLRAKNQTLTFGSLNWPLKSPTDLKLKFGCQSLRLLAADMLVFPQSSILIRGETAREEGVVPPWSGYVISVAECWAVSFSSSCRLLMWRLLSDITPADPREKIGAWYVEKRYVCRGLTF